MNNVHQLDSKIKNLGKSHKVFNLRANEITFNLYDGHIFEKVHPKFTAEIHKIAIDAKKSNVKEIVQSFNASLGKATVCSLLRKNKRDLVV